MVQITERERKKQSRPKFNIPIGQNDPSNGYYEIMKMIKKENRLISKDQLDFTGWKMVTYL